MATRLRIDHDLDPNGHRYLGGRGADLVLGSSGDLTLGNGNTFRVTAGSGSVLHRISGTNWLQGSVVELQLVGGISVAHGAEGGGGYYGIRTPTNSAAAVASYGIVQLVLVGAEWVLHLGGAPLSDNDPLPDGEANPGTGAEASRWDHVHPNTTHGKVAAYYRGGSFCDPDPFTGWTQTSPGHWTRNAAGEVPAYYMDDVDPYVGMRLLVDAAVAPASFAKYFGIYVLTNPGAEPDVHATMERAPDADENSEVFCGMSVKITGGTLHAGQIWMLITADPITLDTTAQDWEQSSGSGGATSTVHNLLTGRDANDCHPMASITPGRVHTPCDDACTVDGDGVATIPDATNGGTVSVADLIDMGDYAELRGLDPADWSTGDLAFLYINGATNEHPIRFRHDCGDVDPGYRVMMPKAGQSGPDYDLLITQSPCFVTLRLFGFWLVIDAQEVTR